ncbi:gamma-glutamyl-gamma-aminobutyrate hydrolase family protein [Bacteroidetes/Chlorobi group bacterium Naka2016]|nr:MAG: gamma-glutamyl-gamma-aminobutyrate hydrolase family protein [Bacteroidetes/Chlorobi group bacterium Naka2016]
MRLLFLFFLVCCMKLNLYGNDTLNILFSKSIGSENYNKYCSYIKAINPNINCINAYGLKLEEIASTFQNIDGLVLTGGPDVNPKYYQKEQDSSLCNVDDYRDSLEFLLLELAFKNNIPIFAICRGEQILNVYLGGTLYPDIPTYFPSETVHRCENPNSQCFHWVYLEKNSNLYKLIGQDSILVNSFHHQGVEKLGKGLVPTAFSKEGLIEAYEWKDSSMKPYFLAVQWHPERLGIEDIASRKLAEEFLRKVIERKTVYQKK